YIGHSALRMYVMGARALSETATDDDLARMTAAVKEAIRAGAMGFSSSRATTHVTPDGTPVASRIADWVELDRLVGAMAELNAGIFQIGPDISGGEAQRRFLARLKQLAVETGRPVMFGTLSSRQGDRPNPWTYQLEYMDECAAAGARMWGQATTRSINAIFSLKSYLPFGQVPVDVMLDLALANDDQVFVQPLVNEDPDHVLGMLRHPRTLATFSDSGAHVCQEMGSSLQTHLLSYWVRAKQAFTLEEAVRKLTFDNASAWELNDRGLVRTGYKADLVVFDAGRVKPAMPS